MAKLLIVDDEEDIRSVLFEGLQARGHSVDVAASADEALKAAEAVGYAYDVVVIDYILPGTRGLDLVKMLRAKNAFLRAIVISGQVDHDSLEPHVLESQLQQQLAVDRYLAKPLFAADLDREINSLLLGKHGDDPWQAAARQALAAGTVTQVKVKSMEKSIRQHRKGAKR